nr:hypothetical protein [Armatimonadota bacterium]
MPRTKISDDHPLRIYFRGLLHDSVKQRLRLADNTVENYLSTLITEFIHTDALALDSDKGDDIVELIADGDVLLGANSFEREREVHKHVGDTIMFWAGLFPEHLAILRRCGAASGLIDHVAQGKTSYRLVSTFVYGGHAAEAPMFERLSEEFEEYLLALH